MGIYPRRRLRSPSLVVVVVVVVVVSKHVVLHVITRRTRRTRCRAHGSPHKLVDVRHVTRRGSHANAGANPHDGSHTAALVEQLRLQRRAGVRIHVPRRDGDGTQQRFLALLARAVMTPAVVGAVVGVVVLLLLLLLLLLLINPPVVFVPVFFFVDLIFLSP